MKVILDFGIRDAILRDAGEEAVTFLGGPLVCIVGIWILSWIARFRLLPTAAQAF